MITSLMQGLIPLLLAKIAALSLEDKRKFAVFVSALANAFLADNQSHFEGLLAKADALPLDQQAILVRALWADGD